MKIASIVVALLVLAGFASAQVGSIDTECQAAGFMGGIVKYEWTAGAGYVPEAPAINPWVITLEGDDQYVEWWANPAVAGVVSKEGTPEYVHPGGTSGAIEQTGQHAISHVTFCYNETVETTTTIPVSEFPSLVLPALLALLVPSVAYVALRT